MKVLPVLLFMLCCLAPPLTAATYQFTEEQPPMPAREFRGAWIASVWNVDWPSKPGLTPAQQRAELIALLDLAADVRLNAIILQVRPEADALYRSNLEPWSYWLTGRMGRGPSDGYDPLDFAVREAHARGIELHAWLNPFRARATQSQPASSDHVTKSRPQDTMEAGTQVWLNPGLKKVQDSVLAVVADIVKRYDVDGIHIDDYFYPYPKDTSRGKQLVFNDSATYQAYRRGGGKLSVEDWRRAQIDTFVQRLNGTVKAVKPWVKVGVSPFGIWRPGVPPTIEASLDSYNHLFADSRKWLNEGWIDYLSPQLYWRIDAQPQSFHTLVRWWDEQNEHRHHLWPGIASSRIKSTEDKTRRAQESLNQIEATRRFAAIPAGSGHIHWSISALKQDRDGLKGKLKGSSYLEPALVPESPWLRARNAPAPVPPQVRTQSAKGNVTLEWSPAPKASGMGVRWWVVQAKMAPRDPWNTIRILPGEAERLTFGGEPSAIAIRSVDATGRVSVAASLRAE